MIPDVVVDALSSTWPGAVILASLQGGVALLVAWVACRVWRTLPPAVACWMWRLAYLKLVLALVWTAPLRLPLLPPEPPALPRQTPVATLGGQTLPVTSDPAFNEILNDPAHPERPLLMPMAPVGLLAGFLYVGLLTVVGYVWLTGVAVGAARLLTKGMTVIRLRRRARPVDDAAMTAACAALAAKMGVRRPPRVLVHDQLAGPLLVGPVRPAIVLPTPVPNASSIALRQVLAHELAHLRRRDLAWNLLAGVADVLFFFHPLLWLARRDYRLRQEAACDAEALAATDSAPADYAGTLIAVAARGIVPPGAFSAGVVDSRKTLERRILAMTRSSNWSRRRRFAAAFAIVAATALVIPPWRVVAQEKPAAAAAPGTSATPAPTIEERMKERRVKELRKGQPGAEAAAAAQPPGPWQFQSYLVAQTVKLQAPADGVVQRVAARSGDRVKKGDLLIELDPRRARVAVAQAEAKLQMAKAQWQRVVAGRGDQNPAVIAGREEMAAQMQIAEAEIQLRHQDLEETRILAPFDGAVRVTAQPGQRVSRAETLGHLTAAGDLRVGFQISERDVAGIKLGQAAGVQLTAFPDKTFKAEITEIAPVVSSGFVEAFARITDPTDGLLPGMNAVLTVPRPAQ
jgi:beta-lactamase regulating signal transducer with metallopeptidase domain